ncbi:hypothetical protein DD594_26190, partial [Enterobacter cloacae complex sp. 4DZ1-17B1]|uniref:hypothetical protein n=1 Tax=Enterobacter cloacae complex sp. 4DZ1-17B1 TaxID=2511991 RepID=UPI001026EB99
MQEYLEQIDLHNYFEAVSAGIDIKRLWEFLTTIKEDGVARVTDLQGKPGTEILITERVVEVAIDLCNKGDSVTKRRDEVKVYTEKKANYTFED